jgi:hypothetical protein
MTNETMRDHRPVVITPPLVEKQVKNAFLEYFGLGT